MGFSVCNSDGCILLKDKLIIGLYVDDILITGGYSEIEEFIKEFKKILNQDYMK